MFQYAKLQIGCLLIILYMTVIYYKESIRTKDKYKQSIFDVIIIITIITLIFDALTAVAINCLSLVSETFLDITHMIFFLGIDAFMFCIYLYLLKITENYPSELSRKAKLYMPFAVNVVLIICTIFDINYVEHPVSNYSQGFSVFACYVMAFGYFIMTFITF